MNDLAQVRGRAAYLQPGEAIVDTAIFERPTPPESLDHQGAREYLNVGRIDPWADGLNHAALWYFITDVPALLKAESVGMSTWGQFVTAGRMLLHSTLSDFDVIAERASRCHRAIEAAVSQWKVGRSAPLRLEDIRASAAFMPGSINAVMAIAESSAFDSAQTIRNLRLDRPDRVTPARITTFETYLTEIDKITTLPRLTDLEIRGHVLAAMHGQLLEDEINAILRSIALPPDVDV